MSPQPLCCDTKTSGGQERQILWNFAFRTAVRSCQDPNLYGMAALHSASIRRTRQEQDVML